MFTSVVSGIFGQAFPFLPLGLNGQTVAGTVAERVATEVAPVTAGLGENWFLLAESIVKNGASTSW